MTEQPPRDRTAEARARVRATLLAAAEQVTNPVARLGAKQREEAGRLFDAGFPRNERK